MLTGCVALVAIRPHSAHGLAVRAGMTPMATGRQRGSICWGLVGRRGERWAAGRLATGGRTRIGLSGLLLIPLLMILLPLLAALLPLLHLGLMVSPPLLNLLRREELFNLLGDVIRVHERRLLPQGLQPVFNLLGPLGVALAGAGGIP